MKMKHLATCLILFSATLASAQAPLVKQWDKRFGGLATEFLQAFQQTNDGGYILGGYSNSDIGGEKTETSRGGNDYWIVKIGSLGNKQWDKRFGGTDDDFLSSMQQTIDGGYILGGTTESDSSGDKTENSINQPYKDYWIVKVDSLGNKEWDKQFGGDKNEMLYALQQTSDGGYILGGESWSGIFGDKTQPSQGSVDYWIVKINSFGAKEWDKRFGGTKQDQLSYLQQTTDGGYILGGSSYSDSTGDKTQNNWGSPNGLDYWVVKIDSNGNKQWDKRFGGIYGDALISLQQTIDGGYILGGESQSPISGDKTESTWGLVDYWVIKIDSSGSKEWDKRFGGTSSEELVKVHQTLDGGYLLMGDSYSSVSGDKSENNLGTEQTWLVKLNSVGVKQWDKTILTPGHDEGGQVIETKDRCYVIANFSDGIIGGYKSQNCWFTPTLPTSNPTWDYWIVKFCDTTHCNRVISLSANGNTLTIYNEGTYQWYLNGSAINSATSNTYIATQGGSYTVMVTDTNGCTATSNPVIISGIEDITEADIVTIYPNPTQNNWQLIVGNSFIGGTAEIFDSKGQFVFQQLITNHQSLITFDAASGIYLLRISSNKSSVVRKLVRW